MSQSESTDLLCKSRREELSADEQRRLNELLHRSLEVKLMSHMLSEFEKESRVRPGDDLLLARISARALGASMAPEKAARRRRGFTVALLAAAMLLVASLAGAWFTGVGQQSRAHEPWKRAFEFSGPKSAEPVRPRALKKAKPLPSNTAPLEEAPKDDSAVAPAVPSSAPSPGSSSALSHRAHPESKGGPSTSASELFARANLLRRQGRGADAAGSYQLLLDLYPSSREIGPTRLALAKYLQAKQPERALAHYRAVAASGDALRAEALWGMAEVATTLGQRALSAQALADLIREFPDSPYAEVARARTLHAPP